MIKRLNYILFLFLLLVIITSCENNETNATPPENPFQPVEHGLATIELNKTLYEINEEINVKISGAKSSDYVAIFDLESEPCASIPYKKIKINNQENVSFSISELELTAGDYAVCLYQNKTFYLLDRVEFHNGKLSYVDNIYLFEPLLHVKNLYYLDVNFYRYYIGREDQSVNESVMISRIDQQIKVNKLMMDYMVENMSEIVKNKRRYQYMYNHLEIVTTVSSILLIRSGTEENLQKKKELWEYLKNKDEALHKKMRHGIMGVTMNLPGKVGRKLSVQSYKICQKIFKFN